MSHGDRKHVDTCLNCGAATPAAYCAECGQEAVEAGVTFRAQVTHFLEEVFTVEARLPRTLLWLLTRPGALTREYNAGKRTHFVTPVKLYLFAAAAFFVALSLTLTRQERVPVSVAVSDQELGIHFGGTPVAKSWKSPEEFDAAMKDPDTAKNVPEVLRPHIRALLASPKGFLGGLIDMVSKATILLVPIHALLLKVLYRRRFYGEHVVFSLHLHSAAYIAFGSVALLALISSDRVAGILAGAAALYGAVYMVLAARTAYREGIVRSVAKTVSLVVAYTIALSLVLALAFAAELFAS